MAAIVLVAVVIAADGDVGGYEVVFFIITGIYYVSGGVGGGYDESSCDAM